MSRRPEHENPPDVYYNDTIARRYAQSSRIRNIQKKMTQRAIELLQLPAGEPCHILDVGCGSGLSGQVLASQGHTWVGVDISTSMLNIAKQKEFDSDDSDEEEDGVPAYRRNSPFGQLPLPGEEEEEKEDESDDDDDEGNTHSSTKHFVEVLAGDMGLGVPFRPGVFDGVISISAVQWLCYVNKKGDVPQKRLRALFQSLYNCLRRGARAVIQFYPESPTQMNMISQAAMKCGFGGGMVVDYPHSARAKKYFLVLYAGQSPSGYHPPEPLTGEEPSGYDDVDSADGSDEEDEDEEMSEYSDDEGEGEEGGRNAIQTAGRQRIRGRHQQKRRRKDNGPATGTKDWVLLKKEQRRKYGLKTTEDSKYTMRRRRPRF